LLADKSWVAVAVGIAVGIPRNTHTIIATADVGSTAGCRIGVFAGETCGTFIVASTAWFVNALTAEAAAAMACAAIAIVIAIALSFIGDAARVDDRAIVVGTDDAIGIRNGDYNTADDVTLATFRCDATVFVETSLAGVAGCGVDGDFNDGAIAAVGEVLATAVVLTELQVRVFQARHFEFDLVCGVGGIFAGTGERPQGTRSS